MAYKKQQNRFERIKKQQELYLVWAEYLKAANWSD